MNFYSTYRSVLGPASRTLFRVAGLIDQKIKKGLELRDPVAGEPAWKIEPLGEPVWIHCASGEFEYAKPVVTRLASRRIPVLVSFFSPTYVDAIKKFSGVRGVVPLPWDLESEMKAFIAHHRPRALLVARTDVWPEMARVSHESKLPSLLFSATLTEDSGRARGLGRWMAKAVLSHIDSIWCVSEGDQVVFRSMGLDAEIKGDTRFDQVKARLENPKPIKTELFASTNGAPILMAGSTWSEDEDVLVEVAKKMGSRARFVFVPHEPTELHLAELEAKLNRAGIGSTRYSRAASWTDGVLLVDQMGILAELYQVARFAFVGGSFKKTVHSVMEPLAAGCLTFLGPLHTNNREALELKTVTALGETTCVLEARDAAEFASKLEAALNLDPAALRAKIKAEIEARTGASDLVVEWVLSVGG